MSLKKHFCGIAVSILIIAACIYVLRWRVVASEYIMLNADGCAALQASGVVGNYQPEKPYACRINNIGRLFNFTLSERFGDSMFVLEVWQQYPPVESVSADGKIKLAASNDYPCRKEIYLSRAVVTGFK